MKSNWLTPFVNAASLGYLKFGWWSHDFVSNSRPIIIAGAPRTGTTLLRTILDNHPEIWIGPENGVFQEGGSNIDGMMACTGLSRKDIYKLLRRSACLGEYIERMMQMGLAKHGKKRWGIKSPSLVFNLDQVFRYFPRAQFIHVLRDGRDVICSLRSHPKYRVVDGVREETGITNPWEHCVARWRDSTTAGLKWRSDSRYCEVKYEDLTQEPAQIIGSILAWLGHNFCDSMLDFYRKDTNEGIDSPHPGVKLPVYTGAMGRWRQDLPDEALGLLTNTDYQLLADCGY